MKEKTNQKMIVTIMELLMTYGMFATKMKVEK